jgi:hypothetical protein
VNRFVLSRLEYDIAWETLGLGEKPTVLAIDSYGHTMEERRALAQQAWTSLRAKDLVSRSHELHPDLSDALRAMVHAEGEVDARLRLDSHGPMLRALAASHGRTAVLATLKHEELAIESIPETALARAMVSLLPAHPLPRSRSVSLLAAVLDQAATAGTITDRPTDRPRDRGGDRRDRPACGRGLPRD